MISSNQVDVLNSAIKSQVRTDKSDDNVFKVNYGEGIKTLRLIDNRVQEIDDRDEIMSEEEELGKNSVFQNNQDQENEVDQYKNE